MVELNCECCKTEMKLDFSGNTWCPNEDCLLHDKCYSFDFYYGRMVAIANGDRPQQKERMAQGWANSPTNNGLHPELPEYNNSELVVGVVVTFEGTNGSLQSGKITAVKVKHVILDGWRTVPKHYVKLKTQDSCFGGIDVTTQH